MQQESLRRGEKTPEKSVLVGCKRDSVPPIMCTPLSCALLSLGLIVGGRFIVLLANYHISASSKHCQRGVLDRTATFGKTFAKVLPRPTRVRFEEGLTVQEWYDYTGLE